MSYEKHLITYNIYLHHARVTIVRYFNNVLHTASFLVMTTGILATHPSVEWSSGERIEHYHLNRVTEELPLSIFDSPTVIFVDLEKSCRKCIS
jgi:hypothetical protein